MSQTTLLHKPALKLENNVLPKPAWSNQNSKKFYEHIPIELFEKIAATGGLINSYELELIKPYIKKANNILEVGGGYGRVINHILKHRTSNTEITTIEQSQHLYKHLCATFSENIRVIHENIKTITFDEKFDLILLMWSGLAEFSKRYQPFLIKKLIMALNNHGILIIDNIDSQCKPIGSTFFKDQTYLIETPYGNLYGYTPSKKDVQYYLKGLPVKNLEVINYNTEQYRARELYIIQKNAS